MMTRWLLTIAVVLGLGMTTPATAQSLPVEDRAAIETVIRGQLAPFLRDDGDAALGFAAPGIQAIFGTPQVFMDMARNGYPAVYQPRTFEFREALIGAAGPEQRAFVVGPDGMAYTAIYPMERQTDGTWRINGCFLVRAPSL